MKTLILNIDRDDDFGRKAKVKSPIIGIDDNIKAANELAIRDPEDSDVNAIFSAISLYKQLVEKNKDVEIATICGDISVGYKSDEILAKQLEEVIEKTKADNVVLVTDGAEDDYILPIIQSRIKITSIRRVSVKQSRELEDTYYRIIKILNDDKVLKQFVLPVALVLVVWAIFVLLNIPSLGVGAIILTLGLYLLVRVFRLERRLEVLVDSLKTSFLSGKLTLYTYFLAGVILLAFILAFQPTQSNKNLVILPLLEFLCNIIWGIVIAGLTIIFGHSIDRYLKDKKIPAYYYSTIFSLFAFGFISYAVLGSLFRALRNWPKSFDVSQFLTFSFIFYTIAGLLLALIGMSIHYYLKETSKEEERVKKIVKDSNL